MSRCHEPGVFPPLAAQLFRHVDMLTSVIGPRHLGEPAKNGRHRGRHRGMYRRTVGSHRVRAKGAYQGPVQTDDHSLTVLRYVERNPLRAGMVERSQDWEWSSLKPTLRSGPEGLLSDGPKVESLGSALAVSLSPFDGVLSKFDQACLVLVQL